MVKLRPDLVPHARRAAREDGADNVFVTLDGDTYAISSFRLPGDRLVRGNTLVIDGRLATIKDVDNQINTPLEGATFGYAAAAAGSIAGTAHVTRSILACSGSGGGFFRTVGHALKQTGLAGLAVAGIAAATAAGGAAYGLLRKTDPHYLDPFGDVVASGD